jgi:hypothetical protein
MPAHANKRAGHGRTVGSRSCSASSSAVQLVVLLLLRESICAICANHWVTTLLRLLPATAPTAIVPNTPCDCDCAYCDCAYCDCAYCDCAYCDCTYCDCTYCDCTYCDCTYCDCTYCDCTY